MFIALLIVTFALSFFVAFIVARFFRKSLENIMGKIIKDEVSTAWVRYLVYAIYVVGLSSGVRVWELQEYIKPSSSEAPAPILDTNHWIVEIYQTIIGTLQGIAWLLLIFFVFAMIAYVIMKAFEAKRAGN